MTKTLSFCCRSNAGAMITSTMAFNINELRFEEPVRNELVNLNRHYYAQNVTYGGKDLLLQTDWFHSSGVRDTTDHKKEILVTLTPEIRAILKLIEDRAVYGSGLQLPLEFQSVTAPLPALFKPLPDRTNFYMKLLFDAACFNQNGQLMKMDSLSIGDYRVVVHVKALYIGFHPSGKLASLQLRAKQLQYSPRTPQCLFLPMPTLPMPGSFPISAALPNGEPETPRPGVESASLTQAKKGRKPTKLQRQNAITEARIQQEEQRRMDTIPRDFFTDAMMELASAQASNGSA